MSFWLENGLQPNRHVLVDLGYAADRETMRRYKKITAAVGLRNCEMVGANRIVVRLPPTKATSILRKFRHIKPSSESPGYCWCSHTWLTPTKPKGGV